MFLLNNATYSTTFYLIYIYKNTYFVTNWQSKSLISSMNTHYYWNIHERDSMRAHYEDPLCPKDGLYLG